MKKIAVLISGSGTNLQAIIDKCLSGYIEAEIVCVLSNDPNAYGIERAKLNNIKTKIINSKDFKTNNLFNESLHNYLKKLDLDLIVLAGFMRILSNIFVDHYLGKLINIHPSLLPKHKGLDTHKKVLENNEDYHGVTVHFVDNTLDGGPICAQSSIRVQTKNIKNLEEEIHKLEHEVYPRVVEEIANGKIFLSQGKVIKK